MTFPRSLLPSSVCLLAAALAATSASAANPPTTQPAASPVILKDLNVSYQAPPAPWKAVTGKDAVEGYSLEYTRTDPPMAFAVAAQTQGIATGMTTAKAVDALAARLSVGTSDFLLVEKKSQTINGMAGTRLSIRKSVDGGPEFFNTAWVYACPHGVYVLISTGPAADEGRIRTEDADRDAGFRFADPSLEKVAVTAGPYHSDRYGYTVMFKDQNWTRFTAAQLQKELPVAEYAAIQDGRRVLIVVPVWLAGLDVGDEDLARAVVSRVFSSTDPLADTVTAKDDAGRENLSFTFHRKNNAGTTRSRGRVVRSRGIGYVVAAWSLRADDTTDLDKLMAVVSVDAKSPAALDEKSLTPIESKLASVVCTDAGILCYGRKEYDRAAEAARAAIRLNPGDPSVVENLVVYLQARTKPADALAVTREYPDVVKSFPRLLARAAVLEAGVGDPARAVTLFRRLYRYPFDSQEAIEIYARTLVKLDRAKDAVTAVDQYREHFDTPEATVLQATLMADQKDYDGAGKVLQDHRDRSPANAQVDFALGLVDLYAQRYQDALDIARGLIGSGTKDAGFYALQGRALMGLKSYRDAKTAFESAVSIAPGDAGLQSMLRAASGMLGQGDNSAIKTPIDPVPIPDVLVHPPSPDPAFGKDANAVFLSSVEAVDYEKGRSVRRTERSIIRVADAVGVEAFNALQFPFDPGVERIYLNALKVYDADGKPVATGSVDDCYATDTPVNRSANFSKVLYVPVPGLKPGYTLDVTLTHQDLGTADHFRFYKCRLSTAKPCAANSLLVRGDLPAIKAVASPGLVRKDADGGWSWTVAQPRSLRQEDMAAEFDSYMPSVDLVDAGASWPSEAGKYLGTIADELKPDPAAAALAASVTAGKSSADDRITAILRSVQTDYTYRAIEFGRRASIPDKPADVIRNKYGDCKDHAVLLQQLLTAAGVRSYLTLVRATGPVDDDAPSVDQFDHMIVCVPAGPGAKADRFYDCTDKSGDLTAGVPFDLQTRHVLVLDPDHPRIAVVPGYADSATDLVRDVDITTDGDLRVHMVMSIRGPHATRFRAEMKRVEDKDRPAAVREMVSHHGRDDVDLQSAAVDGLDTPDHPLVIDARYTMKHRFLPAGDHLIGGVPMELDLSVEHVEDRYSPFRVQVPGTLRVRTTITPPPGYAAGTLPKPHAYTGPTETESVDVTSSADGNITEEMKLHLPGGTYPAADYPAYERLRRNLNDAAEPNLVLDRK